MILINGDLKKIFAGGITYEKVIQTINEHP